MNFFSRTKNEETRETVANMVEELKRASLVKQVVIAECKACKEKHSCCGMSNETDNQDKFEVHTHSDQYKEHLKNYAELKGQQPFDTSAGPHGDPRYVA